MNIGKILAELRSEREYVKEAISCWSESPLSEVDGGAVTSRWMTKVKRPGRPPGKKNKPK